TLRVMSPGARHAERDGYFFSIPSNSAASARKRRSSSFFGWFLSIHCTARSYHSRALSFSPSCQWAMARKNQSKLSPPLRTSIDFPRAATETFQSPARYRAAPSVFHDIPSLGTRATAFLANSTASSGLRKFASAHVESSQAKFLCATAFFGSNAISP